MMRKPEVIAFLDEARTVLREQPGLDSNALLDRLEEKGYTTPFLSTTEKKQIAEKKANEDAANLAQDLKEKSDFAAKQSLETGPEPTASAIAPPKMSAAQIKTMIINEMGGKPDKKDGEYKFGIGGFVKMAMIFDGAGNLSGIKGNNYSAMAKTLAESGAKSISVEGTPLRAFRLLNESVNAGLTVSNVTITKSFPIGDRAWSYDSKKSDQENKEAFMKAFNFIPKEDLNAVFNKLVENRNTLKEESKVVTTPEAKSEQKAEEKKTVELTSDGVIPREKQEEIILQAEQSGITVEFVNGQLTTNGSEVSIGEQALLHANAGAKEIQQDGKPFDINATNAGAQIKHDFTEAMSKNTSDKPNDDSADIDNDAAKQNSTSYVPM